MRVLSSNLMIVATKPIIYTYGKEVIEAIELIHLLLQYKINCIVDCRPLTIPSGNTSIEELKRQLKLAHIFYIPFYNHFGKIGQLGQPV